MNTLSKLFKCKKMTELSYFKTLLENYLYDHFPELLQEKHFIQTHVELAEDVYRESIEQGVNVHIALEYAHRELFSGLGFSQYDYILDIVQEHFSDKVAEEERREFSLGLLSQCDAIFRKYNPLNEIVEEFYPHNLLQAELTGEISKIPERDGL